MGDSHPDSPARIDALNHAVHFTQRGCPSEHFQKRILMKRAETFLAGDTLDFRNIRAISSELHDQPADCGRDAQDLKDRKPTMVTGAVT